MTLPPAKRRKRVIVSDDEEDEEKSPSLALEDEHPTPQVKTIDNHLTGHRALPARLRSTQRRTTRSAATPEVRWTPPSSPDPKLKLKSSPARKVSKSTALDSYLSVNRNLQPASRSIKQTANPKTAVEQEDFIEDDSFDDELCRLSNARTAQKKENGGREASASCGVAVAHGTNGILPTGSQVFRKNGNNVISKDGDVRTTRVLADDTRPWAERYGPTCVEELAVHKKKVADVRDWVNAVCAGRSKKKLLILKGDSGVGKTATITTLAKAMDVEVLEWKNPTVCDFSSDAYVSTSVQFNDFLERSGRFASLRITDHNDDQTSNDLPSPQEVKPDSRKKLILIEEFPNVFVSSSASLQSFRTSVLRYLASGQDYERGALPNFEEGIDSIMPLVMIVTESQVNGATSEGDSFTAHRLLGLEILDHPCTSMIEFNAIAPTYITKALNLVIQKEARDSGRGRVPGPSVLSRLSEVGDVRNAIGSLEFLCLRNQDGADDWGGRVSSKGKRGAKNSATLTKMEEKSLELITRREASLGLFHAVGKVVYNKREESRVEGKSASSDPPTQPPKHLPQHIRRIAPNIAVDDLANETGTDTQTFIAALHENYVLSCAGAEFLNHLNACVEYLSDTDVLIIGGGGRGGGRQRHRGSNNRNFQAAATDSVRQDEVAFQVGVKGLLFGLPWPVKRSGGLFSSSSQGGKAGDAFKMFYPTSMRLARQAAEVEEYVDRWMIRWQGGGSYSSSAVITGHDREEDGVSRWAQRASSSAVQGGSDDDVADAASGPAVMAPSRDAMVLETLPYMALMERHRPGSLLLEDLDRITGVTGAAARPATTEEPPDEMESKMPMVGKRGLAGAVVPPADGVALRGVETCPPSTTAVEQAVGHLYLSEDDIED